MAEAEWIDKDFYGELGVGKDASAEEIKRAYRRLVRENHPDTHPEDPQAEARFKAVGEAYRVLSDPAQRREYDELRAAVAAGGRGRFGAGPGFSGTSARPGPGSFGPGNGFDLGDVDLSDLFAQAGRGGGDVGGGPGVGDALGGLFGGGGGAGAAGTRGRGRRGADLEAETRIGFTDAVRGTTLPLQLTTPTRCGRCGGSGARPGTSPRPCATCGGAGVTMRSQGTFALSEPCRDCRGRGSVIDEPCLECGGSGVSERTRTLRVRVPAGVADGQRIRVAGQGQPRRGGGPPGDLYVLVHVEPHPVFERVEGDPDDLAVTVPVTFPELVNGATITVPTLEGTVSLKVPAGSRSGRTLRVRGRGVQRRDGRRGDLLVTLELAVPQGLTDRAVEALAAYADATGDQDPRAELIARAAPPDPNRSRPAHTA